MDEYELDVEKLSPIDVHVTANVRIWRQLGMWQDREKRYTFVPAKQKGFVIITEHDKPIECRSLEGYTLIRPAGLELAWDTDKLVIFRNLSMIDAMGWQLCAPEASWKTYGGDEHP